MNIALGQINTTVGDFAGNAARIVAAAGEAQAAGARLIVFPELALCGYPPMDLLDHATFVEENLTALRSLQRALPQGIACLVGYVARATEASGKSLLNVAALIEDGEVRFRQAKRLLPTYDVFDEARYFEPAGESRCFDLDGVRFGVAICEDLWWETEPVPGTRYPIDPVADLLDAGARVILAPSASPFHADKLAIRISLAGSIGRSGAVPVVYTNLVGGNDNLIFDGGSFATDHTGRVVHLAATFAEDVAVVEVEPARAPSGPRTTAPDGEPGVADRSRSPLQNIEDALVLGLRDYLRKTGFSRVHLGLSGGIDSAVTAVIAARAVGPENVKAFMLPSQYSSSGSITDSEVLARTLGIEVATVPIEPVYSAVVDVLSGEFAGTEAGLAEENIQARARGVILMAWSNKFGSLLLTTGNKSELAVGYCTLYGDMAGGLSVLGDLFKTEVYRLAEHFNAESEVVPRSIIDKAPSAELRPDQRDDDSLPPYELLDAILERYLIRSQTLAQIVADGFERQLVADVLRLVARSEYKRRQAPPVLKVSPRAFGTGRRMPIARTVYESDR